MRDPRIGLAMVALGVILVIVGLVLNASDSGDATATARPDETTVTSAPPPTATIAPPPPPSEPPAPGTTAPQATTTTTTTTTATTTTSATTTTVAPETRIAAFVAAYAAATDADDVDFLYDSLHPGVIDVGGEELCRAFVAREIVEISNYQLTGPVTGPTEIISGITGYRAEVTFDFMGQTFTDNAQFAFVDGDVRWFTSCR